MHEDFPSILFRLAWADGQVKQAEVDLIGALLEKQGLPLSRRLTLMDQGLSAPPAETAFQAPSGDLDREAAMEALVRLCFADGQPQPGELKILGDLALRWGVSADQLDRMRAQVLGE